MHNGAARIPESGRNLLVSETFVSIQGEGVSAGSPAAFLRLGNCNLACTFCDTGYSWDASRFDLHQELVARPIDELANWLAQTSSRRLIITGGEPLLQQQKLVELLSLLDQRKDTRGLFVEVETNGTVAPHDELARRIDQWNVSPKLENSGESRTRRLKDRALRAFAQLSCAYFKFVVRTEKDAREVDELVSDYSLNWARVSLMPQASDREQLRQWGPRVAQLALARRAHYSGRLHLELFGGRRGI